MPWETGWSHAILLGLAFCAGTIVTVPHVWVPKNSSGVVTCGFALA